MLISLSVVSSIPSLKAVIEAPAIQWQRFFDGSLGFSVVQTVDGGYAVAGINASTSMLIKTDSFGNLSWVKTYQIGGKETNLPYLFQTADGYALAGTWENMFALVKVDSEGNMQWNKTYEYEAPFISLRSFIQTTDGGYALTGTFSPPQNISHSIGQIWFVKTDASGNMEWNKTIVGPLGNFANSVLQTKDGGYTIIGTSWASDILPSFFQIIKTDSKGNVQWEKTFGGAGKFYTAESDSGIITKDGGYLLAGVSVEEGLADAWIAWLVKTDSQGNMMWNKTYGETGSWALSVVQTQDGGYAFAGILNGTDTWVAKTDEYGSLDWNLTFVGSSIVGSSIEDFGKPIIQTNDEGYVLVGTKEDKIWLVKLATPSQPPPTPLSPLEIIAVALVAIVIVMTISVIIFNRRKKKGNL